MLMIFYFLFFLDDNGSQETETQNDIPGNWWFNLIAIQSEVAQSRNTLNDGVVHSIDGDRTDVGAIDTCEYTKEMKVIGLTIRKKAIGALEKCHRLTFDIVVVKVKVLKA